MRCSMRQVAYLPDPAVGLKSLNGANRRTCASRPDIGIRQKISPDYRANQACLLTWVARAI
jgi:hypothetical protein